jgi:hypothetical protein
MKAVVWHGVGEIRPDAPERSFRAVRPDSISDAQAIPLADIYPTGYAPTQVHSWAVESLAKTGLPAP